jgi:hypothetical protein
LGKAEIAAAIRSGKFILLTSRCGTGYRERHSATGLNVVVRRVISTWGG